VNLATGSATSIAGGVSNIQNVIGSAGDDTLTGNALGNILIGGAGTNLLTGGSGRNLLIGGKGTSTIVGGAADDILIAGSTTFDSNTTALMSILQEWQRTDKTYAQRISDLRNGGGFNGDNKLILGTTVRDDDGASKLTGNGGLDWFFPHVGKGGEDTITDLKKGEQVN
jgi:Ca2+-binding RTX toxin-like protein